MVGTVTRILLLVVVVLVGALVLPSAGAAQGDPELPGGDEGLCSTCEGDINPVRHYFEDNCCLPGIGCRSTPHLGTIYGSSCNQHSLC